MTSNGEGPLPPPGQKWSRIAHPKEKGGCGADITAHCSSFVLMIPVSTPQGVATKQQVVRVLPMLCPGCGDPLFFEPDERAVQVAHRL
jgi:hypothetical protein